VTVYGPRFVDVLAALRVAVDGSPEDAADVAAGYVPRSKRSDPVHLNDAGYAIVAATLKARHDAMGFA
jgi:lysophospholipase L1-like esterase